MPGTKNSNTEVVNDALVEDISTESRTPSFVELGVPGLNRWGGYVYEEFLPNLRHPQSTKVYKEMSSNDPVVGAILFAAKQLIRSATWTVRRQGDNNVDYAAAEFLESCLYDMSTTWSNTITEILSMLVYGWSYHEVVYKRRLGDVRNPKWASKYNDGRIGWRKLAGRAQSTLDKWEFDSDGSIAGMHQSAPPDYEHVFIPIEKALLFRTEADYDNPEGRSVLRNAYRPWYFKKRIEEIEGIGIERDLAGLPVLTPPEGVDIWNPKDPDAVRLKQIAEQLVTNIRRDQNEGIVKPFGWELTLLSTGSRRQFDTNAIINRYDQRIAITILADIVMLGAEKVGSFALSEVKKGLFAVALETFLDSICDVFNRYAIPKLFSFNAFPGLTKLPKLEHSEIETPDLTELARYIQALSGSGMPLFPDTDLENYLRQVASMPKVNKNSPERQAAVNQAKKPSPPSLDNESKVDGRLLNGNQGR